MSGRFFMAREHTSLPGTTMEKLALLLHTAHQQREIPHKDPKVLLAEELGPRCCTFLEHFPGAPAWAQSQKWAQSGHWHRLHVSSLMVASWCWKCKSSKPTSIPYADVSLVRLPFCEGTAVLSESSQNFVYTQNMGPSKTTCKNNILLYEHLRT